MLESLCSSIENGLSCGAIVPIIGSVPALVKIGFGTTQAVTAMTVGVFAIISISRGNDVAKLIGKRAWSHVKHGLGNVAAGLFEGIPFVGTIIVLMRIIRIKLLENVSTEDPIFINEQAGKLMPYSYLSKEFGHFNGEGRNKHFSYWGMSYKEAASLGIIDDNFEIIPTRWHKVCDLYKQNKIQVQGKFYNQRENDREIEYQQAKQKNKLREANLKMKREDEFRHQEGIRLLNS